MVPLHRNLVACAQERMYVTAVGEEGCRLPFPYQLMLLSFSAIDDDGDDDDDDVELGNSAQTALHSDFCFYSLDFFNTGDSRAPRRPPPPATAPSPATAALDI